MKTKRLTTAQAIIQFLIHQHVERDGRRQPFFAGCLGIFGHGCIAGIGQAINNSETAVAMVQTAEGALDEINTLLNSSVRWTTY